MFNTLEELKEYFQGYIGEENIEKFKESENGFVFEGPLRLENLKIAKLPNNLTVNGSLCLEGSSIKTVKEYHFHQ